MLRTLDIVLIVVMTGAATVTYTIKHQAENKLEDVRKLDANIKLEEDTIDLLRADWALLTQPNRLEKLVNVYAPDLQLVQTAPTQIVHPQELPMMKADVPPSQEVLEAMGMVKSKGKKAASASDKEPAKASAKEAKLATKKPAKVEDDPSGADADNIATGSVTR